MIFSKNYIRFILGGALAVFTIGSYAAANHSKPTTLIKHIASHGGYAIINLSKDVTNELSCPGGSGDFPSKLRTFVVDYSSAEGKSNYVLIMAAAAAKKKTSFIVTQCDNSSGYPIVDSVETIF